MPRKIDRGMAVVEDHKNGTVSVFVCSQVVNGKPVNVYATYDRVSGATISSDVPVRELGHSRSTEEVVDVYGGGGTVRICKVAYARL